MKLYKLNQVEENQIQNLGLMETQIYVRYIWVKKETETDWGCWWRGGEDN